MNPGSGALVDKIPRYSSLGRLNEWMKTLGFEYYSFVNVFAFPGAFKLSQVDYDYLAAVAAEHGDRPVVALGGVASTALKRIGVPHFTLPHPSYRNRKLNDPTEEKCALERCVEYIRSLGDDI